MAFGVLSEGMITALGDTLLETIQKNCLMKGTHYDDADTRKQAVKALI